MKKKKKNHLVIYKDSLYTLICYAIKYYWIFILSFKINI